MAYDPEGLHKIRANVRKIGRAGTPKILFMTDRPIRLPDRVGILPGSFNPLTLSHIELARRAKKTFRLDEVVLSISKVTVDKETVTKPSLEERLFGLKICAGEFHYSVALASHGLLPEQAMGLRDFYGDKTRSFFLIGYDKLPQIFDPKYYRDRSASLDLFFSLTRLIVANRGEEPLDHITDFLKKPDNRKYAQFIDPIFLPSPFPFISSTQVREKAQKGEPIDGLVPKEIQRWIAETGVYKVRKD